MYIRERPLINSLLTGIVYFFFSWSIDLSDLLFAPYAVLMQFLPGLTFPLTTAFPVGEKEHGLSRRIVHIILSVAIYYGCVWLFSGHLHTKYLSMLAGFIGSVGYLVISRLLLKYPLTKTEILVAGVISGLSFLPFEIFGGYFLVGLAILLWTLINGFILDLKYKTTPANIV